MLGKGDEWPGKAADMQGNEKAKPRFAEQGSRKENETNTIKTEDLTMKVRITLLDESGRVIGGNNEFEE